MCLILLRDQQTNALAVLELKQRDCVHHTDVNDGNGNPSLFIIVQLPNTICSKPANAFEHSSF